MWRTELSILDFCNRFRILISARFLPHRRKDPLRVKDRHRTDSTRSDPFIPPTSLADSL